jgi:hypothetical protein
MMRLTLRWATDLLSAFAPEGGLGLAPLTGEVDYAGAYLTLLRGGTRLAALGLVAAVWLLASAPAWRWGRFVSVSRLAPTERARLLAELLRHRWFVVRELTLLLKLAAALALLGVPSVRARSGYDNVQVRESGLQRRLPLATRDEREVS